MATQADLEFVRDYVGTEEPTDNEIFMLIDEVGTAALAAQRILLRRRADLLASPAKFGVTGYNEDNTANIQALTSSLDTLEGITGVGGDETTVTISQMYRTDRCGR